MKIVWGAVLMCLCCVCGALPLNARERADVLREEIVLSVPAEGAGADFLLHSFPRFQNGADGKKTPVKYNILSVTRNQERTFFYLKNTSSSVNVFVGRAGEKLRGGKHVYVITYASAVGKRIRHILFTSAEKQMFFSLLVLIIYFILVWQAFGTEPERAAPAPSSNPPENLSPAAMLFLKEKRASNPKLMLASMLLNLAVKGVLVIEKDGDNFIFKKGFADYNQSALTVGEEVVLKAVISAPSALSAAQEALRKKLKDFSRVIFRSNFYFALLGWVLAAVFMVKFFAGASASGVLYLSGYIALTAAAAAVFRGRAGIFIPCFLSAPAALAFMFIGEFSASALFAAIVAVTVFYAQTSRARRSSEGIKMLNQTDAFILYLENPGFEAKASPEERARIFCASLPYAVALGMEERWNAAFKDDLKKKAFKKYAAAYGLEAFNADGVYKFNLFLRFVVNAK